MSILEMFNNAHEKTVQEKKDADWQRFNRELGKFIETLPKKIAKALEKADRGKPVEAVVWKFSCARLHPIDFDKEPLGAQLGFQKLLQYCGSPDNNIAVAISVEDKNMHHGESKPLANIELCVDPSVPFNKSVAKIDSGFIPGSGQISYWLSDIGAMSATEKAVAATPKPGLALA